MYCNVLQCYAMYVCMPSIYYLFSITLLFIACYPQSIIYYLIFIFHYLLSMMIVCLVVYIRLPWVDGR